MGGIGHEVASHVDGFHHGIGSLPVAGEAFEHGALRVGFILNDEVHAEFYGQNLAAEVLVREPQKEGSHNCTVGFAGIEVMQVAVGVAVDPLVAGIAYLGVVHLVGELHGRYPPIFNGAVHVHIYHPIFRGGILLLYAFPLTVALHVAYTHHCVGEAQ